MITKIQMQNAGALVRQKFEPVLKLIADYEAGADPGDWRKDEKLVKLFGFGTSLEAVILYITQNYKAKPKRGKAKMEIDENG